MLDASRVASRRFATVAVCWIALGPLLQSQSATPIAAAEATLPPASPETAAIDALYRLDWLPRLLPGVTTRGFSSYDRTGGNNDGFSGAYSKLRVEQGDSVLAEMSGPGCIQRIWFTHSEYTKPGLLNLKREHIRIYADGGPKPVLDVPLEDVFFGKLAGFPKPLVGEGLGGYYCYVPVPYRNGCKVVVQGTGVRFYQINYRSFPSAEGRTTFVDPPTAAQRAALARAAAAWSACGDLSRLGVGRVEETTTEIALTGNAPTGNGTTLLTLPPGPRRIRAVWLRGVDGASIAPTLGGRIAFDFDGAKPAIDMPIGCFFCQALDPPTFRSLWVGRTDRGLYNFLPMPYRRQARLTLVVPLADKAAAGERKAQLIVATEPLPAAAGEWGYLHAAYHESLPTKTGKFHPFLETTGRGHYVGTYLVTEGVNEKKLPLWLEGDDRFTVDGELRIHGTGSEDYFNGGWYAVPGRLNGPGGMPLHGFPVYGRRDGREQAAAYRWHLTDPVHFDAKILAEMEHGATNDVNADYRSAAYYYADRP